MSHETPDETGLLSDHPLFSSGLKKLTKNDIDGSMCSACLGEEEDQEIGVSSQFDSITNEMGMTEKKASKGTILRQLGEMNYPLVHEGDKAKAYCFIYPELKAIIEGYKTKALKGISLGKAEEMNLKELILNAFKIDKLVTFTDLIDAISFYKGRKIISDAVLIAEASMMSQFRKVKEQLNESQELVIELQRRYQVPITDKPDINELQKKNEY